jgi:two-component system phosphate regulon response regulator OmpR
MKHLLIVDDDKKIVQLLQKFFSSYNYTVTIAYDVSEARNLFKCHKFDLIVLDIMMPGETGTEFTSFLKSSEFKNIPIILLSAKASGADRIFGLEVGADDYLTKPFELKELLLRVENLINRYNKVLIRNLEYDFETKQLYKNDININLSTKEIMILDKFIKNLNQHISREDLAKLLKINERSIDVMITRLRNKIEDDPKNPQILKSVRNYGYVLYK